LSRGSLPSVGAEIGRYRLLRQVGEGARGVVYEADDPAFDRSVAVKILKPEFRDDPEEVRSFLAEAEATSRVQHECVVSIHDSGESGGHPYYVMEFVDGPALDQRLETERLDWRTAVEIAVAVGRALAEAHALGYLHRDVKPGNILLGADGRVRLTDFGIVKDISSLRGFLVTGKSVGTAAYASPEQCRGKRLLPATDVYSLGATLYHMVAGRMPFPGSGNQEHMRGHVKGRLVPPSELAPEAPRPLSNVIVRMMARSPLARYETMAAALADLEEILAGRKPLGGSPRPAPSGPVRIERDRTERRATERVAARRGRTSTGVWIAVGLAVAAAIVALGFLLAS
jgi:serine/threonine protein kinase